MSACGPPCCSVPFDLLLVLGVAASACAHDAQHAQGKRSGDEVEAPYLLVITAGTGHGCPGSLDIKDKVLDGTEHASGHLERMGFRVLDPLEEPNREELLQEVSRPYDAPVLFLYSGHAVLTTADGRVATAEECVSADPPCRSAACLPGGSPLAFAEIVAMAAPSTPLAVFLLDACSSADVDVRRARTNAAVISASPLPVKASAVPVAATLLTQGIQRLDVAGMDLDCDGAIDDEELFRVLSSRLEQGGFHEAIPKLRRQVWTPTPLLAAPTSGKCVAQPQAESAEVDVEILDGGDADLRALAPVSREGVLVDGVHHPASALVPVVCSQPIGQCFRIREERSQ
jgi:hypothetical protein